MKRNAFTLIEILVAVSIFSGILILSMGALARSTRSASTVEGVRQKTEAARTVIDQISNDFQYLFQGGSYMSGLATVVPLPTGFQVSGVNQVLDVMVRYPNNAAVFHRRYELAEISGRNTITVQQESCGNTGVCVARSIAGGTDLISERYELNDNSSFSASGDILTATIVVKELGSKCTTVDSSACYTLKSQFVAKTRNFQ